MKETYCDARKPEQPRPIPPYSPNAINVNSPHSSPERIEILGSYVVPIMQVETSMNMGFGTENLYHKPACALSGDVLRSCIESITSYDLPIQWIHDDCINAIVIFQWTFWSWVHC